MSQLTEQQISRIEAYHEGILPEEDRAGCEAWLKETHEAGDYLRFLEKLGSGDASSRVQPPADMVDRIMNRVETHRKNPAFSVKWVSVALPAACLAVFIGINHWRISSTPVANLPAAQSEFTLNAPGAKRVEVAGDFTGWKKVTLRKETDRWRIQLPVAAVKDQQYVFILNEKLMVIDPANDRVVRYKKGLYSVLSLAVAKTKGGSEMSKGFLKTTGVLLSAFLNVTLIPQSAMAETASALASQITQEAQGAGWSRSQIEKLIQRSNGFQTRGVSDATLEALVADTLPLGKESAMEKTFSRLESLIGEGLAPDDAGKVVIKEVLVEQKDSDEEMAGVLSAGLKDDAAFNGQTVMTHEQIEQKLEEKREEWEAGMEKQDQILSVQNTAIQTQRSHTSTGL